MRAVAGSASELAWEGAAELGQHQVDSLGCHLEQLGPERHGDQRTGEEQLHQIRQLRVGAGRGGDPAHELTGLSCDWNSP